MQAKITARTIKSLSPKDKPFEVVDSELKGFLLRIQPTGRMTFYYAYRNAEGKRKRIKIGVLGSSLTLQQARDAALDLASQVTKGKDVQGAKQAERRKVITDQEKTLGRFIELAYLPWALENLKRGQSAVNRVNYAFPSLMKLPMHKIAVADVEAWRTQRLKDGLKSSTINRDVNCLRGVLTKALEWEVLEEHPLKKLKSLAVASTPNVRFLNDVEDQSLIDALEKRDEELKATRDRGNKHRAERASPLLPDLRQHIYADRMTPMVLLSLKTGMRRGELFDLEWHHVNFEQKVITIAAETAKTSKSRYIPLSPIAMMVLKNWQRQAPTISGRVFPSDSGGRLDHVNRSWASILKLAEIFSFRWHDMRHDFASKLVMRGVPLNTVRELCGHSELNTTLRYAHLAPDHKASAIALIG